MECLTRAKSPPQISAPPWPGTAAPRYRKRPRRSRNAEYAENRRRRRQAKVFSLRPVRLGEKGPRTSMAAPHGSGQRARPKPFRQHLLRKNEHHPGSGGHADVNAFDFSRDFILTQTPLGFMLETPVTRSPSCYRDAHTEDRERRPNAVEDAQRRHPGGALRRLFARCRGWRRIDRGERQPMKNINAVPARGQIPKGLARPKGSSISVTPSTKAFPARPVKT